MVKNVYLTNVSEGDEKFKEGQVSLQDDVWVEAMLTAFFMLKV
jgi:hypothetical protein